MLDGGRLVIFHKRVAGISESVLNRFLARARDAVHLKGTVNVLVTSSTEMRSLNRRFRGKDKPTDVLSFPAVKDDLVAQGKSRRSAANLAGEIAISSDIASRSARLLGHGTGQEIKILTLHGLLHLAGHDHETDNGDMARRERILREQFHLPTALIERAEAESNSPLKKTSAKPKVRK